ncbi:MAG: phenylacetate-CoA oxygenase subunit PaaI [Deltaproteobacteria bacterium]|nr:phenylacetate-CoA oxygenase subunit PaaI [Deltaproteobacteria bacterium]
MGSPLLDLADAQKAWHQGFVTWTRDIGVPLPAVLSAALPPDAGAPRHRVILFGDSAGQPLWKLWRDIPGVQARDMLLQMVATQADCHMGSVEMHRGLFESAPTQEDHAALRNVVEENLGHAAALGALLIRHFPKRGAIAAAHLLERRAENRTRVLNAFNQPLRHWVDLYCFVAFVSLCARFALETLAVGGFAQVAATAEVLARRHEVQSRFGAAGLARVVEAGRVGVPLLQRYINRWVALGLDLFGWERSETAALAWRAGLKGRVHERERAAPPEDPTRLNDDARVRWLYEVERTLARLNTLHDGEPLRVPPWTANRTIGAEAAPAATPSGGDTAWPVPTAEDDAKVLGIAQEEGWVLPA